MGKLTHPDNEFEFKPRRVWEMNGSTVCTLPAEWVFHWQLDGGRTLRATMDSQKRLVLEPAPQEEVNNE